jgi:hypothetical protein
VAPGLDEGETLRPPASPVAGMAMYPGFRGDGIVEDFMAAGTIVHTTDFEDFSEWYYEDPIIGGVSYRGEFNTFGFGYPPSIALCSPDLDFRGYLDQGYDMLGFDLATWDLIGVDITITTDRDGVEASYSVYAETVPHGDDDVRFQGFVTDSPGEEITGFHMRSTRARLCLDNVMVGVADRGIEVGIDIRPGSPTNPVNLKSRGSLPVAILSSAGFDAADVDVATVELAGTGVATRGKRGPMAALEDIDGDGLDDLVVHFETQALVAGGGLTDATTSLELTGKTVSGQEFTGTDVVRIVP